jgi:hypothetical protein
MGYQEMNDFKIIQCSGCGAKLWGPTFPKGLCPWCENPEIRLVGVKHGDK